MNELRTLIDLCPGTRLPQYEPEIFSDPKLTEYYLHKLCGNERWYTRGISAPRKVYQYAFYVMKCRWPEAETVIAIDPQGAYYYALHVMKCRWPEAEAVITTDPYWVYLYASGVMKSRWPEAETVIAADRQISEWYNKEFGTKL